MHFLHIVSWFVAILFGLITVVLGLMGFTEKSNDEQITKSLDDSAKTVFWWTAAITVAAIAGIYFT